MMSLRKPQRCKSWGCHKSEASKGDAVVYYREPLATTDMGYARFSRRVKTWPILYCLRMSILVDSRNLDLLSQILSYYCLKNLFVMFFMQLRGKGSSAPVLRPCLAVFGRYVGNCDWVYPTRQRSRMLQIRGARGCSCPDRIGTTNLVNKLYAVCSAFP